MSVYEPGHALILSMQSLITDMIFESTENDLCLSAAQSLTAENEHNHYQKTVYKIKSKLIEQGVFSTFANNQKYVAILLYVIPKSTVLMPAFGLEVFCSPHAVCLVVLDILSCGLPEAMQRMARDVTATWRKRTSNCVKERKVPPLLKDGFSHNLTVSACIKGQEKMLLDDIEWLVGKICQFLSPSVSEKVISVGPREEVFSRWIHTLRHNPKEVAYFNKIYGEVTARQVIHDYVFPLLSYETGDQHVSVTSS